MDTRIGETLVLLSTHKKIAKRIASELRLSSKEADYLEKGSITPDYWKDFPHHYGKESQIREYVLKARRFFLDDEKFESLFSLGLAFHYLQDCWVTVSGSSMNHGWWEDQIDDAPFVNDIAEMLKEFDLTRSYHGLPVMAARQDEERYLQINDHLLDFEQLCRSNFEGYDGQFAKDLTLDVATLERPKLGTPIFDLNFAYRVSLVVALSVYGSRTSLALQEKLEQTKKEFEVKLKEAEEVLVRKLVELYNRKAELEQKGGFFNWLKRLTCNLSIWFNRRRYEKRSHLLEVRRAYHRKVEWESSAFRSWYNITIPELNIEQVKKLLS